MKKLAKLIPIFCILITTILSIIFFDLNESKKYFQFDGYEKDFINIKYSDTLRIDNSILVEMIQLANENEVIIEKLNTFGKDKNIYISMKDQGELLKFLGNNFNIQLIDNYTSDHKAFISTYNHGNDYNQIGLIPDLLENDYYNYYTFDNLLSNNGNLYGEYIIYYNDYSDFDNFSKQLENILGQSIDSFSSFNEPHKYIVIIMVCSIIILLFFYFIFQVFEVYYKSKQVACMRLLGFDNWKISHLMILKRLKIYIYIIIFLIIISLIFIKNITLSNLIFLLIINLFLIVLTYLINFMCTNIILKGNQTTNILKKENVSIKISKTNGRLKIIIVIFLIILISFMFKNLSSLFDSLKLYNDSKDLLNYAIIDNFNLNAPERFYYEKQVELYTKICNDSNLKTFYSEFNQFVERTEDEQKLVDEWYDDGTSFLYGSVDRNYLNKEGIVIYDLNYNKVDLKEIDSVFFLFPKSKINKIEQFNSYYERVSKEDYEKYNIDYNFKAYIYDDNKLNTYKVDSNLKYVDSPIIRVIDESIALSYLETSRGISIFGNGLSTGLKFEIIEDKNKTFNILENYLNDTGLYNLISINNFLSFNEYFNDEIRNAELISAFITVAFILVLIVYIIITIQVVSLYGKSQSQEVLVKYLLGYRREDIFSKLINKVLKNNLISFIITLILLNIIGLFNVLLYIFSIALFIIIDFIVLFLTIKFYNFSNISVQLKGGNYD